MGVRGASPFYGSGTAAPFNGWRPVPPSLALHPKALRQIGNWGFSERTPEVLANLSWEVRFFEGNGRGDRSIGEANLRKGAALQWLAHLAPVRGVSPFNGSGTAAPFNGWRPCRPKVSIRFLAHFYGGPAAKNTLRTVLRR